MTVERDHCNLCRLWCDDKRYKALWGQRGPHDFTPPPSRKAVAQSSASTTRVALPVRPPCRHEGRILSACPHGDPARDIIHCDLHRAGVKRSGVCRTCNDHRPQLGTPQHPAITAAAANTDLVVTTVARFDEHSIWPGVPGKRFNASLAVHPDGGYLFAARNGWAGSDIYVGRLDADFRPAGPPAKLELRQHRAGWGREDPRLFWHGNRLHVAYIGVSGRWGPTHQMFARLTPDGMAVEDRFHPQVPQRRSWEKNFGFFDCDGQLYATYLIAPLHRVLRIDSNMGTFVYETPFLAEWQGGEMRGGAAPVLVGDEYYHFFHDRIEIDRRLCYRTGLYAFSARPPFTPTRWIPEPILTAMDFVGPDRKHDNYADVLFCCGSVLQGDRWLLSHGLHDRFCEIHSLSAAALEARMVRF